MTKIVKQSSEVSRIKLDPQKIQAAMGITPKGSYYNLEDQQLKEFQSIIKEFSSFDRTLASLIFFLLEGTAYSKGRMTHHLLSNPISDKDKETIPSNLPETLELELMNYMLDNETIPRSLKNLIMLTGGKKENGRYPFKKINNSRGRKLILQFIFDRENQELDSLAVKYKTKIRRLVTHALGEGSVKKIFASPNPEMEFKRTSKLSRYNPNAFPVLLHLFNMEPGLSGTTTYFPKIQMYRDMREAAKSGNVTEFKRLMKMKKLPFETVLGFRNTYKVPVDLKDVHEESLKSDRQKLQSESAAKRTGAKVSINYNNQDLFDLLKIFYHKVVEQDSDNIEDIVNAIELKSKDKSSVSFGKTAIIFDVSHSMRGNKKRPLHPFLVGMALTATIDNVQDIIYSGGSWLKTPSAKWPSVIYPDKATNLWECLVTAASKTEIDSIVLISDGYENSPAKGTFSKVYQKLKSDGFIKEGSVIHINPVFASETGSVRQLDPDIPVLPVPSHKGLEMVFISSMLLSKPEQVKELLARKYQKLITKGSS